MRVISLPVSAPQCSPGQLPVGVRVMDITHVGVPSRYGCFEEGRLQRQMVFDLQVISLSLCDVCLVSSYLIRLK